MKKYYLHNGVESSGPFDLAELQMKQITAKTPVWFSGMPDWKTAGEIDELQTIIKVIPPPFKSVTPTPQIEEKFEEEIEETNPKIMGLKKNTFYIVFVVLVLIIGSIVLTILQENRRIDFEEKNNKTEKENRQFQLQEKEIQEQKQRISEQEKLEEERLTQERKAAINSKLSENQIKQIEYQTRLEDAKNKLVKATQFPINSKLSENQIKQIEYQTRLEDAKNKLVKATQFQFFRTPEERTAEINAVQTDIDYYNNEILSLENERNQLELELEKIHLKERQNSQK
ncbi:MAG: hypothetical protein B7Y83_16935 [Flavobacteriales bacterium 32-34-25]|nr:MAG: hypothetical protein B7Y83_16935 [Flavobacteriales bacterium 32-34-25]